ncbi:MAG: permease [Candidatus Bathyarchaeota archaeon]|nr:permease [Candidatus Bathyarchaeota archaeon]MDW8040958.1 permease [Nitrososphaerota archaeon]
MKEKTKRNIRAGLILAFMFVIMGLMVYSRVTAKPSKEIFKEKLDKLGLWESPLVYLAIPALYIADYFSHAWICLLFAFSVAGLIYEFVPKETITRYMGRGKAVGYALALLMAPFLTVCSCTMVPLFGGILYAGAGIGPAISFLLMAPAANILTILMTGEMISWEIAGVRILVSVAVAIIAGLIVSTTPWGKTIEKEFQLASSARSSARVEIVKPPLDERLWSALKFAGYLAKQILPFFIVGLIVVGYLSAFIPEKVVETYLTGVTGVLIASVLGGPLYTPTLVEVALGQELWSKGMSKGALLSWLMGQPYDFANAMAVSRIAKWKVVATYMVIAWAGSVTFGLLYGFLSGSL